MSRARSLLASVIISPLTQSGVRTWHETKRRILRQRHRVVFYHRVADAWSWLLAQMLPRLLDAYDAELEIRLVSALPMDCIKDPQRLDAYAAYDAMRLARAWQLDFPDQAAVPTPDLVHLAERIVLARPQSLQRLLSATAAAWGDGRQELAAMAQRDGAVEETVATKELKRGFRQLVSHGHYLSGMLYYQGEWFWGLDRLFLLEERLRHYGLQRGDSRLADDGFRPIERRAAGVAQPVDLEFYFSFRSPYSYIAAARVAELSDRLGLNLVLRPVLPMVMRGVPVPLRKQRYIIQDVARVGRHLGIAFGPIRDPLGKGVEWCLAGFHVANLEDRGREFMLAAMRGIWTGAADFTRRPARQTVASAAGLSANAVAGAVESGSWRAQVEANAAALAVIGLWGVPAMCLRGPDDHAITVAWGQDRLWSIERAALGLDVAMPPPRLVQ